MPLIVSGGSSARSVSGRARIAVTRLGLRVPLMLACLCALLAQSRLLLTGPAVGDAAPLAASPRQTVRVRKNLEELSRPENAAELNNLRHAFEVLIQRSLVNPDDPRGYIHYADLHNDDSVGPCDHVNDVFQAWHRAHLLEFEKALQDSDPDNPTMPTKDVMLPYWDWTARPSGQNGYPQIFEEQTTADGRPNIFYWPDQALCDKLTHKYCDKRNQYPAGGPPYPADVINTILGDTWPRFGGTPRGPGSLETRPHNHMHGTYVGSDMGDNTTAAYDPIFWVFHTNIDRLMEAWQELHQPDRCAADPNPSIMPDLNAPVRGIGNWPPSGVVKDFLCVEKLGYKYDSVPTPTPTPAAPPSLLAAAKAVARRDAVALSGTPVSLKFRVPPAPVNDRVYLELPGLSTPPKGAYEVRVYLHPRTERYRPNDPAFADKYFAGSIVVWAIRHRSRGKVMEHRMTSDYSLNISEKFNEISRTNAGKDWVATVVTTPVGGAPPAGLLSNVRAAPGLPSITVEGTSAPRKINLTRR